MNTTCIWEWFVGFVHEKSQKVRTMGFEPMRMNTSDLESDPLLRTFFLARDFSQVDVDLSGKFAC